MTVFRSLLYTVWLYVGSTVLALAYTPMLILPRSAIRFGLKLWGLYARAGLALLCGIRVEVRGAQYMPTGPALIAAKHQGMLDVCGPFTFLPDTCFVLKKELIRIPFFGWYCLKSRMIVVDREGHAAALKKLVTDTQGRMKDDRQVVIFPEGTRKKPGAPADYKPGVAALYRDLGLPCTPVATNSGAHWPAKGIMRYPGVVVFEFLEPIPAGLKRGAFMTELESRIEGASAALLAEGL